MLCAVSSQQNFSNYIPEIIGIIGTILGTILGWLLHLISENVEKTYIFVEQFSELRSQQNEYACILKLFIYNASYKQQCIRNARISFTNYRKKVLFESILREGECSFDVIGTKNNNIEKISMVSINGFGHQEFVFSSLINKENCDKISSARKIYLLYEDKKNRKKKKLIKSDFFLDGVGKSKWNKFE